MKIFLDTSSLFKLYHEEDGTAELDLFIKENNPEGILIAEITIVEFVSAVSKKARMKMISEEQAEGLISLFEKDLPTFNVVEINREIISMAKSYVIKYREKGLRALDSIQLACTVFSKDQFQVAKTHDDLLKEIMGLEKINTN